MKITNVKIYHTKSSNNRLLAFAKIVIEERLVISGIKIFDGNNGEYLSFPNSHNHMTGKTYDICFPITREFHSKIVETVLNEYFKTLKQEK